MRDRRYPDGSHDRLFSYDDMSRLVAAEGPYWPDGERAVVDYEHDSIGNRLSWTKNGLLPGESRDFQYLGSTPLLERFAEGWGTSARIWEASHDPAGNLTLLSLWPTGATPSRGDCCRLCANRKYGSTPRSRII